MFIWLPSYLMILFGLWSVRDLCYILWVGSCHALLCHDYCVPPKDLSSTCVLGYAILCLQGCMPCIFVINVVTSTSMQSSSRDIADFRDLEFHQVFALLLFLCHVSMMLQSDPCLFWVCSVRMILGIWLCSIHPCPCLHLWSNLAWLNLALLLL